MSREIKFRIWYPNHKRMTTGAERTLEHACMDIRNGKMIFNIDELDYDENFEPEYYTDSGYVLMQYTGLKDKNGKEIYEGDIIRGVNGSINGVPCAWNGGVISYGDGNHNVPLWGTLEQQDSTHWFEVIGNIYENPELMDGAK